MTDSSRYIAFEGIEGSGKSTVTRRVADALRANGEQVVTVREPGGTAVGEMLRDVILGGDADPAIETEAALFAAARAELVATVVRPALEGGSWVLSDRTAYSSLAYQAYGRGLDVDAVRTLNDIAIGGLWPGRVVLLRVDHSTGLDRQRVEDRIGAETAEFHARVAKGFDELAAADPDRFIVIDASAPLESVIEVAIDRVVP